MIIHDRLIWSVMNDQSHRIKLTITMVAQDDYVGHPLAHQSFVPHRMEKLTIRRLSSQAKIIGTIVSILGALLVVLYKGPTIIRSATPSTSLTSLFDPSTLVQSQWVIGGGLLALEYVIVSIWYIFQVLNRLFFPIPFSNY